MSLNFDTAFGVHPQALLLREKRGELLAANLANADTPGYKAQDLDFQAVLKQTQSANVSLETTRANHIASTELVLGAKQLFRVPNQASLDGNTVETQVEQAKYAENGVQYQASLRFINGTLGSLMTAIRGS